MALMDQIMEMIGGPHPAAVATLDGKLPAIRFMVLSGFPDMTLVGATIKSSKKVGQLKKNPETALTIRPPFDLRGALSCPEKTRNSTV
jgi:pyridoxine/pyridoxamine 5'-phosphate oxidase